MDDLEIAFSCILLIVTGIAVALLIIAASKNRAAKKELPSELTEVIPEVKSQTPHPLAARYEVEVGSVAIPPGMKECYQCKTLIRADALTCPQCGKDPSKASETIKVITVLVTIVILVICGIWFFSIQNEYNKPSKRCIPATEAQLDFINYAVSIDMASNYIQTGYAVKSNDYKNVYMVAVLLYGPSMEEGTGPAVFAVGGDPETPHTWMAVNAFAKEFTDLPDASTTDAQITISADGVEESISCAKNTK